MATKTRTTQATNNEIRDLANQAYGSIEQAASLSRTIALRTESRVWRINRPSGKSGEKRQEEIDVAENLADELRNIEETLREKIEKLEEEAV
jgi:hypothetical protein